MIPFLLFILVVFLIYSFIRRTVYFKPVSALFIGSDLNFSTVPVKPNRSFFSSFPYKHGFVRVAPDLYLFYSDCPESSFHLTFKDYVFNSEVYIFKVKRSRFVSVDFSDRSLSDIVSKFNVK